MSGVMLRATTTNGPAVCAHRRYVMRAPGPGPVSVMREDSAYYGALWILFMVLGWLWTKALCLIHALQCFPVPKSRLFPQAQSVIVFSVAFVYVVNITSQQALFPYVFSWKRSYFWLIFLFSNPIYAFIGTFPSLACSLVSDLHVRHCFGFLIAMLLLAVVVLGFLGWHLHHAKHTLQRKYFVVYVLSRLGVSLAYGLTFTLYAALGFSVHVHHWLLAWILGMFCTFAHPLSTSLLGVCLGVFMNGLGKDNVPRFIYG
jgi:hypothetical protein